MRLLIYILLFTSLLKAEILSQWRGQLRNGHYPETGLLQQWPEGGPSEVFRINDLGKGFTSPAVTADRFFITGLEENNGVLL